jgi:hypothetical protein
MQFCPVPRLISAAITLVACGSVACASRSLMTGTQPSDLRLRVALTAAFSLDPYLWSLPVTLDVEDGGIIASGSLYSPMQKRLAMRRLRDIVGSSTIVDGMTVLSPKNARLRGWRFAPWYRIWRWKPSDTVTGVGTNKRSGQRSAVRYASQVLLCPVATPGLRKTHDSK